ncbi:MAG: methyltransferase [Candidatus Cloacimonetes bacterium]|nr:methyltransferase [Candidatus Cloacimonadota bacterium]MBL7086524.1 methyltransferase [Candidatus Cloacimonadota bacterium]
MKIYTLDDLQYKNLKLIQSKNGYRSSEDSLILLNTIIKNIGKNFPGSAFEFGTGSGIISILLAAKIQKIKITAIEVQNSLFKIAQKNIQKNNLLSKINLLEMDGRKIKTNFPNKKFDIAFSNPPYFPIGRGRLSPNLERRNARHEILCNMNDVLSGFEFLLKKSGLGFMIYPSFRWKEFDKKMRRENQSFVLNKYYFFKNLRKKLPENLSNPHLRSNLFVAKFMRI